MARVGAPPSCRFGARLCELHPTRLAERRRGHAGHCHARGAQLCLCTPPLRVCTVRPAHHVPQIRAYTRPQQGAASQRGWDPEFGLVVMPLADAHQRGAAGLQQSPLAMPVSKTH